MYSSKPFFFRILMIVFSESIYSYWNWRVKIPLFSPRLYTVVTYKFSQSLILVYRIPFDICILLWFGYMYVSMDIVHSMLLRSFCYCGLIPVEELIHNGIPLFFGAWFWETTEECGVTPCPCGGHIPFGMLLGCLLITCGKKVSQKVGLPYNTKTWQALGFFLLLTIMSMIGENSSTSICIARMLD